MDKVALITGVTGQDGAYLAELLLAKGYVVHGVKRRSSSFNTGRVDHLYVDPHEADARFFLHYGDLTDATNLIRIVQETQPDEIYNLAAQSHVQVSFETPEYTANADALGTLRLLEAIRILGLGEKVRFYQASTSELYGKCTEPPQNETTPFYPRCPYAAAKLYAYWITVNYREAYGMHASNGILFNHEGPTRGETFVTRKITRAVAAIELGLQDCLYLGNLDAKRDWGHARDYVEGMWLILQQDEPDDYVLATGESALGARVRRAGLRRDRPHDRVARARAWTRRARCERTGRDAGRDRSALFPADRGRPSAGRSRRRRSQRLGWRHKIALCRAGEGDGRGRSGNRSNGSVQRRDRFELRLRSCRASASGSPAIAAWSARALVRRLERERCEILTVDARRGRSAPAGRGRGLDERRRGRMRCSWPRRRSAASSPTTRRPAEFLYDNLAIEANIIHAALAHGVEKLLFLGSSCIYPKLAAQPMSEDALLTGPLGADQRVVCRRQDRRHQAVPGLSAAIRLRFHLGHADQPLRAGRQFRPRVSHVVPALIAKTHAAKEQRRQEVEIWGTGTPRREFLYVDDLADALRLPDAAAIRRRAHVNVGTGEDVTIRELAGADRPGWSDSRRDSFRLRQARRHAAQAARRRRS